MSSIPRVTTANNLPSNVLEILSDYVEPREQALMEDACIRLHQASQRVADYRRHLADYSTDQRQAPQLPSCRPLQLTDMPLNNIGNILSFLHPSERALPKRELEASRTLFEKRLWQNTLDLQNSNIDDATFIDLIQSKGDRYSHINLSGCSKLTGKSLNVLAKFNKLKSLDLSFSNFTDSDILPLFKGRTKRSPGLRSLNLSYCQNISGRDFGTFTLLQRLNLTGCKGLLPQAYKNLSQASSLETLVLAKTKVTDENVEMVRGERGRTNLRSLDLRGCTLISSNVIKRFSRDLRDGFTLKMDDRFNVPRPKQKYSTAPRHDIGDPLEPAPNEEAYRGQIRLWQKSVTSKRTAELWKIPDRSEIYVIKQKAPKALTPAEQSELLASHLAEIQLVLNSMTTERIDKLPLPVSMLQLEREAVRKAVQLEAAEAQKKVRQAVINAWNTREFESTVPLPTLVFPLLPGQDLSL